MSIKIVKQFGETNSAARQNESVLTRLRARRAARKAAEALVAARRAKKHEGEGDGEQIDDIALDASTASVIFSDKDANVQVVVGEDPKGGITVAVATAEADNLEEEEVLASVTVGEGENPDESQHTSAVEEARKAIKARLNR